MTLHLLKTDWRRLWPWILLAWLAMLVVAIPGWSFDFESFTPWFRGLAMQWPGIEPPADPPEPAPVWLLLLHSLRHWTVLPALAVSAMLGFGGMVWDGTRPLRRVDFLRSKLLAILLFLVVPQLLVLASVLAVQGLGAGPMLAMALRTGAPLFLLHLASLLFGRLCGGLWPWLAGVAALAAIAAISPAEELRGALPPFLIVQGTADRSVTHEDAVVFAQRLTEAGGECRVLGIEGAPHRIAEWPDFDPDYARKAAAWLAERLGKNPPDPHP